MKNPKTYAYEIFHCLEKHYPEAKMILEWSNNFELLVSIMLSAQCTDLMVNKVTKALFPKYRKSREVFEKNYQTFKPHIKLPFEQIVEIVNFAFLRATELEQDIKSTGFYRNKAKNIQSAAKVVLEKYSGQLPRTIHEMVAIPGVGRKTANVFLGNAYHISEGIAVDTHVRKQAQVFGLTKNTDPDKIEQDLMKLFDKKDWFRLTYFLIEHGRNMRRKKTDRMTCHDPLCKMCST